MHLVTLIYIIRMALGIWYILIINENKGNIL